MSAPSTRSVLLVLRRDRLAEVARQVGAVLPPKGTKEQLVEHMVARDGVQIGAVLPLLGRDELKAACRSHEIDDMSRSRTELAARIMSARAPGTSAPPVGLAAKLSDRGGLVRGAVAAVRQRQYLVTEVVAPPRDGDLTLVRMVCLDDDAQGRPLEVLWEHELGAHILEPHQEGLGDITRFDTPRDFAAYWHALQWNRVTATSPRLFQAPFRAGIQLKDYQLTPLMKALELPRANLFIADDVGLGKTIEAGLVLQELLLRQRVDWALVVCPAAVTTQWRIEMEQRFGIRFEIYDRAFVAQRRQERGFAVNPWTTHSRFIISYSLFRRPEYREPLMRLLGEHRKPRSLLILDEAHTAAPATGSKYAVDSEITKAIRAIAPRFENRLFLSATPHNGHSNSFAALLNLLDPQRFLRAERIDDPSRLAPVMVRRLKSDLLALHTQGFPIRRVVQLELRHGKGGWTSTPIVDGNAQAPREIGDSKPVEIELSEMLAEYSEIMRKHGKTQRSRLVFVNLQKRLLSSVYAFARTLHKHADPLLGTTRPDFAGGFDEDDDVDAPATATDERKDEQVAQASRSFDPPTGRALDLLRSMVHLADAHKNAADAKVLAILDWVREHQCDGVKLGGGRKAAWKPTRLILFTEYGHTKDHLVRMLRTAFEGTDRGEDRLMVFDGGMDDVTRGAVQDAFNSDPQVHPVRVLVATDAAREGVNLQGACSDLIHVDVPWNPARMEQRNGRIDRTLQPETEVRCMYFVYADRAEDRVLPTLVRKVGIIHDELGSLGEVLTTRITAQLERDGLTEGTAVALDEEEEQTRLHGSDVSVQLERVRNRGALGLEIDRARKCLDESRELLEITPDLLKDVIDVGLSWAGADALSPLPPLADPKEKHLVPFRVPLLDTSWERTLDSLRAPRKPEESFRDWRDKPLLPVVFEPPNQLSTRVVHLHLSHPFVQRILSRFRSQGFSAHDLARVTVVADPKSSLTRVVAMGRLSLFGSGATRLHDEIVMVTAAWRLGVDQLKPFADDADRKAQERLASLLSSSPALPTLDERAKKRILDAASGHFSALWHQVQDEAEARSTEAKRLLNNRGRAEADELRKILESQLDTARKLIEGTQLRFEFGAADAAQKKQVVDDRAWLERRITALEKEFAAEPDELASSYDIELERVEPIGLVYLWPTTS
jgi:superfamily II DNA or RNA helicase